MAQFPGGQPQRIFVVSLVPLPGSNPTMALRGLLKIALRRFKLRCIDVREEWSQKEESA